MTNLNQVYKCSICGNIVEVLHAGGGELVCCGKPMELLSFKTQDIGFEKHLPVVEMIEGKVIVKVGSIPHPMEEAHFIEWIEVVTNDKVYRKFLKPGDEPSATFELTADSLTVRCFCNIHGLWQK